MAAERSSCFEEDRLREKLENMTGLLEASVKFGASEAALDRREGDEREMTKHRRDPPGRLRFFAAFARRNRASS